MVYKLDRAQLKELVRDACASELQNRISRFGEGACGAVPTHKGGGTLPDGKGTLIGHDEMMVHDRALEIQTRAPRMNYEDCLKQARDEIAAKKLAEQRGPKFSEAQFAEGGRIPIDMDSARLAQRANEIVAEKKCDFGQALRLARAEMRDE
jgi:hypothetical protein